MFLAHPRCKNLLTFFFVLSLLRSFYLLFWLHCFLCFTSLVKFTGSYTGDDPCFYRPHFFDFYIALYCFFEYRKTLKKSRVGLISKRSPFQKTSPLLRLQEIDILEKKPIAKKSSSWESVGFFFWDQFTEVTFLYNFCS